jgi:hypothetical protein
MSISNFSVSQNTDAIFLNGLDERVKQMQNEKWTKVSHLFGKDLQNAQASIIFELEEFRLHQIQEYCRTKDLPSALCESDADMASWFSPTYRNQTVFPPKREPENFAIPFGLQATSKGKKQSVFVRGSGSENRSNMSSIRKRNSSYVNKGDHVALENHVLQNNKPEGWINDEKEAGINGGREVAEGEGKRESHNRQSVTPEFYQGPGNNLELDLDSESDQ